jgi:chromate transporter
MRESPAIANSPSVPAVPQTEILRAPTVLILFLGFLRLGLTAFGGPAMIAQIKDLAVRRRGWIDDRTFDDGFVLSQSLPGATAMQVAAYVGLRAHGTAGAVATYVGLGLPAFVLMMGLSAWYARAQAVPSVLALMNGLQIVVVALIAHAAWTFGRPSMKSARAAAIAGGSTALYLVHVNPFAVIASSAAAGLALFRAAPAAHAGGPPHRIPSAWWPWAALAAALAAGLAGVHLVDPRLFQLSVLMLRVNLLAFSGGFSSLPLMLAEVVDGRHWMTARTFMDGIALGQVTPGPISITATFIGYHLSGFFGAVVATVAMFTPSLVVLLATAPHFDRIRSSALYARASKGIAAGFVGLLAVMAYRFAQGIAWSVAGGVLGVASVAALFRKIDVLYIVLTAVVVSLLFP